MKDRSKLSSKITSILDWIGRIQDLRSFLVDTFAAIIMIASCRQLIVDSVLPYLQANSFPNIVVFVLLVSVFALFVAQFPKKERTPIPVY